MKEFKIQCGFPFPLIKERLSITHSVIEKPSGLSYLLLVTIQHSDTVGDWDWNSFFEELGIRKEVYPLIESELIKLIQREIIVCDNSFLSQEGCLYEKITHFHFTEKGKKVFQDKQIPSEVPGKTETDIFFKPYDQSWALAFNSERFETRPISNSALSEDFVLSFSPQEGEGLEDFLSKKKGSTELGVKKEEEILDVQKISDYIPWYIKIDGDLVFSDSFAITFKDKKVQEFFDKNYTASLINHIIELKLKFNLGQTTSVVLWKTLVNLNASKILTPDQTEKILQRASMLFLSSSDQFNSSKANFELATSLPLVSENQTVDLSFATFDGEKCQGYLLAKLGCEYGEEGIVYVPALVQMSLPNDWFSKRIREHFREVKIHGYEEIKTILDWTQPLEDVDFFLSKLKEYLPSDPSDSLSQLSSILELISKEKFKTALRAIAKEQYLDLIDKKVDMSNYMDYLSGASWVLKKGMISQGEALQKICEKLSKAVDSISLFTALKQLSFSEKNIVQYVNPLPDVDENTSYEDSTLQKAGRVISDLKKLKSLIGAKTPFDYTYSEDVSLLNKIKPLLTDIEENFGSVSVLEPVNAQVFKEWKDWVSTFETVAAKLNVLSDASLAKMDKNKLEKLSKKGELFKVCISLCQIASDWLSSELKEERADFIVLINMAKEKGLIDSQQADALHALRMERNKYAHPSAEAKPTADPQIVSEWINKVFDMTEEKE